MPVTPCLKPLSFTKSFPTIPVPKTISGTLDLSYSNFEGFHLLDLCIICYQTTIQHLFCSRYSYFVTSWVPTVPETSLSFIFFFALAFLSKRSLLFLAAFFIFLHFFRFVLFLFFLLYFLSPFNNILTMISGALCLP